MKDSKNLKYNQELRGLKENLKKLVELGNITEAKEWIDILEHKFKDIDLNSFKGIVALLEGNVNEAEKLFKAGLEKKPYDTDLYFNLAYIYENSKRVISAYRMYKRLLTLSDEQDVRAKINELEQIQEVKKYINRKKVLVIAYIFPPLGGSGVQRTLKFVKYLQECNLEPIVVTVGKSSYGIKDETLISEIPNEIEVIRIDEKEVIDNKFLQRVIEIQQGVVKNNELMKRYIQVLNNSVKDISRFIQVPDNSILFAKQVIDDLGEQINLNEIDLIYSTSGPYSDHIIGYYLKQRYKKPWIADFRDEWTNNSYIEANEDNLVYKMHHSMEQNILQACDIVLTTTPNATKNYIENFNLESDKVLTITNGYDEEDFKELKDKKQGKKFKIVHNGIFYMIRTPETILKALNNLIDANLVDPSEIEVNFTLVENEDYWKDYASKLSLNNIVKFLGNLSHSESLENAINADLLLLVVGEGEKCKDVYPGKAFEYLRLGKRILSLSPKHSLVEYLIENNERGRNVEFQNIKEIENYIVEVYTEWKKGNLKDLELTKEIKKFDRKELTKQLSEVAFNLLNNYDDNILNGLDTSEKDNLFYDSLYEGGGWDQTYYKHYSETHYIDIWLKANELINSLDNPSVIDIGCGPGQFANLLFDNGITNYKGMDFSEEAIKYAKIRNDKYRHLFIVDDAYKSNIFNGSYNTCVIFEVLEHIDEDLEILSKVKRDTHVLFSVPNFYSPGHVRWFNSQLEVVERYNQLVNVSEVFTFSVGGSNKIYLVFGQKK